MIGRDGLLLVNGPNRMQGYLPGRLVPLLINLHIAPRPIWLTRHGESAFNVLGIIGGDADLSPRGEEYAQSLARFVSNGVVLAHGGRFWIEPRGDGSAFLISLPVSEHPARAS